MTRGQPSAHGLSSPPAREACAAPPPEDLPEAVDARSMAGLLSHRGGDAQPSWNEAALSWKHAREADPGSGMDSLLAHERGPGKSASEWRPSSEADDRRGMAAVRAHKMDPETFPVPQVRQGTFVGWQSN